MKLKSKLFVICLAAAAIFTAAGVYANAEALDFHVTERGMT
ncbi:phosphatase [Bacillus subtilis]|nr:phosphatase [Bacillus subtilis]